MEPSPPDRPAAAIEIDAMFEYHSSTAASRAPIFLLPTACARDDIDALALPGGSRGIKRRTHAFYCGLKLKPDT
jgi:hypothetical protein